MTTFASRTQKAYSLFVSGANALQSFFLLLVRVYWGWQFVQTGWGKLHNLTHVIEFFASLGIPAPAANAYFVSALELVGGVLLALGLGGRLIAAPLAIDMLVAYATADRQALMSIFSDPGKFYGADPFTFLVASLIVLIFGSGSLSLDSLISRLWARDSPVRIATVNTEPARASSAGRL